jgi:hypothetical protein
LGYDLENIETQVRSIIIISAGSRKGIQKESEKALETIQQECDAVRLAFKRQLLSNESEQSLTRYFHFHQHSLITLLNKLTESITSKVPNSLTAIAESLLSLLKDIANEFPEHFDLNQRVPKCLTDELSEEVDNAHTAIKAKFHQTQLDPDLLEIILHTFDKDWIFETGCVYGYVYFFRALKSELCSFDITSHNPELLRIDMCNLLVKANFNCELFFKYYTRRISNALATCETLTDRIDQLAYFYKVCSQEHSLARLALHPESPSIDVQLVEWISQELEYHRNKQLLQLPQPSRNEGVPGDFKLNFDLSVSHLAYLFKSFIETGVVQNKNTSELIRFLTKFVKTKKSEAVSYESFRIKFYNPETGTKDAVKKTLQSLLNYMNKN